MDKYIDQATKILDKFDFTNISNNILSVKGLFFLILFLIVTQVITFSVKETFCYLNSQYACRRINKYKPSLNSKIRKMFR